MRKNIKTFLYFITQTVLKIVLNTAEDKNKNKKQNIPITKLNHD